MNRTDSGVEIILKHFHAYNTFATPSTLSLPRSRTFPRFSPLLSASIRNENWIARDWARKMVLLSTVQFMAKIGLYDDFNGFSNANFIWFRQKLCTSSALNRDYRFYYFSLHHLLHHAWCHTPNEVKWKILDMLTTYAYTYTHSLTYKK